MTEKSMRTIRWGIIGCGDVTEVKSGPAFQRATGSELVAVMRRDAAKAADYARRHNVPRWYDDADALIADKDIDAIYIATPPGTHELFAMKALAAGKPCYVEKPMARCAPEARRMVDGFKKASIPLFVAYYRRALPRFLKARELIDSGALGRVHTVTWRYADGQMVKRSQAIPWRMIPEHSGGGPFLDLGSHALDMLDFWVGPLKVVEGRAWNTQNTYEAEDHVTASFVAAGGVAGIVECNFTLQPMDELAITGDAGEARLSCFGSDPVRAKYATGRHEFFDLPNPPHVQQPLIQTVVDELLGVGKCPSTGESALRTQEVMDRALVDFYGGREDGFWKRT